MDRETELRILNELAELEETVRKEQGEQEAAGVAMAAARVRKMCEQDR